MTIRYKLKYLGDKTLESRAEQCAEIIATAYTTSKIGRRSDNWALPAHITINIDSGGGLEIGHFDDERTPYTGRMAIITGIIGGIGLGLGKEVNFVDDLSGCCMTPTAAAVRFASFDDFVDAVNVLAAKMKMTPVPVNQNNITRRSTEQGFGLK